MLQGRRVKKENNCQGIPNGSKRKKKDSKQQTRTLLSLEKQKLSIIEMSDIEIYKSPDNKIELQVNLEKDTVWLSQKQMAELFDKDSDTIGLH